MVIIHNNYSKKISVVEEKSENQEAQKVEKDLKSLLLQIEDLRTHNDDLEKSIKKIQAKIEDTVDELDAQRARFQSMEKKLRTSQKDLSQQKAISDEYSEAKRLAALTSRAMGFKSVLLEEELEETSLKIVDLEVKIGKMKQELGILAEKRVSFTNIFSLLDIAVNSLEIYEK